MNHPQQLGLGLGADRADLIEKDGAVVGDLKISLARPVRASECAFHMPEQRGFEQVRRQRTAVYWHEHELGARRVRMNGLGYQFLAGSRLPRDQNRGAAGSYLAHQIEHSHHALALANNVGETVSLLECALEVRILIQQAPLRDAAVDLDQQLVVLPRLGEVIVGA